MNTQLQSPTMPCPPSGRRAGATWVAATGAFLLLAGAAVFVAVKWDQIPEMAKLLILVGITGACLAGGRALRRQLPSTGDVLFHLGAFLLPVDMAAIGLRTGMDWRTLLLAEGVLGCVALGGLGLATGSVVLTWAGIGSVIVLAAGVAAVSPVPAAVSLALVAVTAELVGRSWSRRDPSTARGTNPGREILTLAVAVWATVAGLAPVIAAAFGALRPLGQGTLADLGLATTGAAAISSLMAAGVLACQARRRDDVARAFLALASLAVGAVATFVSAGFTAEESPVALAGAFVVVEAGVLCLRRDPFWSRPAMKACDMVEAVAMVGSLTAGLWLLAAPFDTFDSSGPNTAAAGAFALAAIGWLIADLRRYTGTPRPFALTMIRGGAWPVATIPLALTTVLAVGAGTGSTVAVAAALVAVGGLLTIAGRPLAAYVTAASVPWALLSCISHPAAAPVIGVVGAIVAAEAALHRRLMADDVDGAWSLSSFLRTGERGPRRVGGSAGAPEAGGALGLSLIAVGTALGGLALGASEIGTTAAVFAAVPVCWLLAAQLDRSAIAGESFVLGDLGRGALIAPLLAAFVLSPGYGIVAALIVGALFALDALRLDRPEVGIGSALAAHVVVAQIGMASELGVGGTGLALCVTAVAWAGLAAVVDERWRMPFLVAAGSGLALGLVAASNEPVAFATAGLIAGALGISAGVITQRDELAHAGGIACILAIAGHLALQEITAGELYVLPVAIHLLVAGVVTRSRRPGTSSWTAYAPAAALVGGAALSERLVGGAGWHAVVAGAVGILAVGVGGWLRLAGPLMVGTGLLVVVTILESMSTLAGVPTWAWLVAGGAILLGTGVVMERSDTSPVEAGRRLVDVVDERFT